MNRKIIATIIALGMVAGAFAMMATPASAAPAKSWAWYDLNGDSRLPYDTISGEEGLARWGYWTGTAAVHNTAFDTTTGDGDNPGTPYSYMSDFIGVEGRTGSPAFAAASEDAATGNAWAPGMAATLILERDPNCAALALDVYDYDLTDWTTQGSTNSIVPNGYIWAGIEILDGAADQEAFPSGTPPTTFFRLMQMAPPVITATTADWAGLAAPEAADTCGDTEGTIQFWGLLEATANTGPWAQVTTATFAAGAGTQISFTPVVDNWYSAVPYYTSASGILGNCQRGTVYSQPVQYTIVVVGNEIPVVTVPLTTPAVHDGNIASELVTITATITDDDAADILTAEYQVDALGWTAMTGSGVSPRAVTATFNFPNGFLDGDHTVQIRGSDTMNDSAIVNADFTVTDTTDPAVTLLTPSSTISRTAGGSVDVSFTYEDFTDEGGATLYYWNQSEVARTHSVAMVASNFRYNSFMWDFDGSFAAWGNSPDVITWEIELSDSAATPNVITTAQQTVNLLDASANPPAPAEVYGIALQYNGVGGVYTPLPIAGATVTIDYYNGTAWLTQTYTPTNALGQYSFDIPWLADLSTVFVNVTANGAYPGSLGYNSTVATAGAGGEFEPIWQNVVCGVPYDVLITYPLPTGATVVALTGTFDLNFRIVDINDVIAPGYYSFGTNVDVLLWPDSGAAHDYVTLVDNMLFNGIAGAPYGNGFYNGVGVLQVNFPVGMWWLNVSDGGPLELDNFLTPWGAWTYADGTLGYYKDYCNITFNVTGGGFEWSLVQGWNIVSCPQDGTFRVDGNTARAFNSWDALNWTNQAIFTLSGAYDADLAMFTRTAPGTYTAYLLDTGLGFDIDSTLGYWVYMGAAGPYTISFYAVDAVCTDPVASTQDVAIAAGWNLLGLQRNYSLAWVGVLNANDFTDGTVAPLLAHTTFGGAYTKLTATTWVQNTQWYMSYVVDVGFPGMIDKDWQWITAYSPNPGNGFWLWANAGGTITYSTLLFS